MDNKRSEVVGSVTPYRYLLTCNIIPSTPCSFQQTISFRVSPPKHRMRFASLPRVPHAPQIWTSSFW